jgi:hypothetical protein
MRSRFFRGFKLFLLIVVMGLFATLSSNGDSWATKDGVALIEEESLPADALLGSDDDSLQFVAKGHALGFRERDVVIAAGDHALRIEFVGARSITPEAEEVLPNTDGNRQNVSPLERVVYPNLWDGVTLVCEKHSSGVMKSTYIVEPLRTCRESSVEEIRLRYNVPVEVHRSGELVLSFETGNMMESRPVAWQEIEGKRIPVEVSFRPLGEQEVGFEVGSYDREFPIVIDPLLSWHTFLGSASFEYGYGIAVDADKNIYVVGFSGASWGSPIRAFQGMPDAFVAKLDQNGALVWNTFLGSAWACYGYSISLDGSGNLLVTGTSKGTWGTPVNAFSGNYDAFVAKLSSDGVLLWNTFIGGDSTASWGEWGYYIAVDGGGHIYVVGLTYSAWGSPINSYAGGVDAFVAKLNSAGDLVWLTFMGSSDDDYGYGIAVDGSSNVFIVGSSMATWGSPLNAHSGAYDTLVAKLDSSGTRLWHTFLGSSDDDEGFNIKVDGSGNSYIVGYSEGTWGTPINSYAGAEDVFVAKLNSSGAREWNTFLGSAANDDFGIALALDGDANVFVSGYSDGTWGSPTSPFNGDRDALIAELSTSGALQWHTFMGSSGEDWSDAVAVDGVRNIYVAATGKATWGSPVNSYTGDYDAIVAKFIDHLPVVDIKANGSDSTITISQGDPLSVTIELEARGSMGNDADWWILKKTSDPKPNNWYYFDFPTKSWLLGRAVTLQRGLFDTGSRKVPKTSGLAPGTYTFFFAIDMMMNGSIDVGEAYFDKIKVIITP